MVAVMARLGSVQQVTFTRDLDAAAASVRAFEGRKYDYRPRNPFEDQYANYPAQAVETVRNQVVMTALRGLAVKLGSLREGRKAIVFVSEGFASLLPPQMRDPNAQFPGMMNPAASNPNAGSGVAEDRARFRSDSELYSDLSVVFDTANRHNTAIYAIDRAGWRPASSTSPRCGRQAGSGLPARHAGHAAGAGAQHRRPGHREPQRPRQGPETGRARRERLLSGWLQLVCPGRRQVPRDQDPLEAAGRPGAIAQGLHRADRR
jgi:hypothetical protein